MDEALKPTVGYRYACRYDGKEGWYQFTYSGVGHLQPWTSMVVGCDDGRMYLFDDVHQVTFDEDGGIVSVTCGSSCDVSRRMLNIEANDG